MASKQVWGGCPISFPDVSRERGGVHEFDRARSEFSVIEFADQLLNLKLPNRRGFAASAAFYSIENDILADGGRSVLERENDRSTRPISLGPTE